MGFAPHYQFSRRLEGTADLLLNRSIHQFATTNISFYSLGLGLRVRL